MEESIVCCNGVEITLKRWKANQGWKGSEQLSSVKPAQRVLCLSESQESFDSFHYLGTSWASADHEVVVLDLPRQGLIGKTRNRRDDPSYLFPETTFYIKEAVESLKWSPGGFILVGYSSGTGVACCYAAVYPEDVNRLILLEGLGPSSAPAESLALQVRLHVHKRRISNLALMEGQRQTVTTTSKKNSWDRNDGTSQVPYIHNLTPEQVEAIYQNLQCPICLLLAEDGLPINEDLLTRTLGSLKPSVFETLPGSHNFHADPKTADEVCRRVLAFSSETNTMKSEEECELTSLLAATETNADDNKIKLIASHDISLPCSSRNEGMNNKDEIECSDHMTKEEQEGRYAGTGSEFSLEPWTHLPQESHLSRLWTRAVQAIREPFINAICMASRQAALRPKTTVILTLIISFGVFLLGFSTSFYLEDDEIKLWTPEESRAFEQGQWIESGDAGFPLNRPLFFMVHTDGRENVLTREGISRVFAILDGIRSLEGYDELCSLSHRSETYVDTSGEKTCFISSATAFWEHDRTLFEEVDSDENCLRELSSTTYPNGVPVDRRLIIGLSVTDNDQYNGTLKYGASYRVVLILPEVELAESFEVAALDFMNRMAGQWKTEENNPYRLDYLASRSFSDEFKRAIVKDVPLVPGIFVLMSSFCCIAFFKRDRVRSQTLLGVGAVVSVVCAIATSFGVMFLWGVPFTALVQVLPFIIFGIGLDDAFIIVGSYARTDQSKDTVLRVEETIRDCGGSILITSLTSAIAFGLGAVSTIPAIRWLCLYAFPTILIDFVYQVTFFVALIVIDEKRMKDRRLDCLICFHAPEPKDEDNDPEEENLVPAKGHQQNIAQRFMSAYADFLLKPATSMVVALVFAGFLVLATFKAMTLTQAFDFLDVLPTDSYIADYIRNSDAYSDTQLFVPMVYFRDVDFSSPTVQNSMFTYVDKLVELDQVSEQPTFFWLRDFHFFLSVVPFFEVRPFEEQLSAFLRIPVFEAIHARDIVRGNNGKMLTSRTSLVFHLDETSVTDQMDALADQAAVSEHQPENRGAARWKFFAHDKVFYLWEYFSVVESELVLTTVIGVISVCLIALLFIPHWTAVFLVGPMVCMLYIQMLGIYQMIGLHVNSITYVSIVMSIGLMVDYVMHVVIRYFESKESSRLEKTRDTLETMGVSILIGGLTTLLGIMVMALASSEVFHTFFKAFFSLVVTGMTSGLILLPVVLSMIGPEGRTKKTLDSTHPSSSTESMRSSLGDDSS